MRNGRALRLPINETITVRKDAEAPRGALAARHEMWLFGMKFLTLEYRIFRKIKGADQGGITLRRKCAAYKFSSACKHLFMRLNSSGIPIAGVLCRTVGKG